MIGGLKPILVDLRKHLQYLFDADALLHDSFGNVRGISQDLVRVEVPASYGSIGVVDEENHPSGATKHHQLLSRSHGKRDNEFWETLFSYDFFSEEAHEELKGRLKVNLLNIRNGGD